LEVADNSQWTPSQLGLEKPLPTEGTERTDAILLGFKRATKVERVRSTIVLEVKTLDSETSVKIADAYLRLLVSSSQARRKRRESFLLEQLDLVAERVRRSELALENFRFKNLENPIPGEIGASSIVDSMYQLEQQLVLQEVALRAINSRLESPGDLEAQMGLVSEKADVSARIEFLSAEIDERRQRFNLAPELSTSAMRLQRDLKVDESAFQFLRSEYESARIASASAEPPLRIVERPRRTTIPVSRGLLLKAMACLIVAGLLAGMSEYISASRR